MAGIIVHSTELVNINNLTSTASSSLSMTGATHIHVISDVDVHVKINSPSTASDFYIPAKKEVYFMPTDSAVTVNIIADSAASGKAWVSKVELVRFS